MQGVMLISKARRFAKHRLFDNGVFRRTREEKLSEFRRKQREQRRNSERRKFKADKSDDKSKFTRSLDVLPRKCVQLMSDDLKDQIDAITYFRRILALDRNPPLAAVYETGVVFPRLTQFLTRYDSSRLQTEAAWCITNIACGDSFYIQALIKLDVLPLLMGILYHARDSALKEQTLWALCNLSCEDDVCFMFIHTIDYFTLLLQQLSVAYLPTETQCVQHMCATENPALSTMRHITIICGQILKVCRNLDVSIVKTITFTFADLLQSPDDEIIEEICQTLSTVCTNTSLAQIALEQGVLSRLLELAGFSAHRDSAMACIFSLFANCPESQRRAILYKLYTFTQPSKTVASFILDFLSYCFSKTNHTSKRLLNTLNSPSISSSLSTSAIAGENGASPSESSQTCNFALVREVLVCIQHILGTNSHYYEQFTLRDLLSLVQMVVENPSSYEGKVEAGFLLCDILKRSSSEVDVLQVTALLFRLTHTTEDELLKLVLDALCSIFQQHSAALVRSLSPSTRTVYKNSLHFLNYHSNPDIIQRAAFLYHFL